MRSAGYHEKMIIGRTYFGGDQVTQLNLVLYNTIKWPYQPKHSTNFKQSSCRWQSCNDEMQYKIARLSV